MAKWLNGYAFTYSKNRAQPFNNKAIEQCNRLNRIRQTGKGKVANLHRRHEVTIHPLLLAEGF